MFQLDAPVSTSLYVSITSKWEPDNIQPILKLTLSKGDNSRVLYLEEEEGGESGRKKLKTNIEKVSIRPHEEDARFYNWQNMNKWKTRFVLINVFKSLW